MKPATLFPLRLSLFKRALLLGAVSAGLACAQDADLDGIPDASDPFPATNAVVADPDGNNNLPASLQTGLIGRWDCQQIVPTSGYHGFADLAGNDQPLACRTLSMSLDNAGIISKAALFDGGNDHLAASGTLFHNRAAFTTSLWFKTAPGAIQNKPGNIHTVFFACNDALDAYPELAVSIYKGVVGSLTQKIVVSRYVGSTLSMTFYGEIPLADYLDDGYWHHLAYVKNGNNNRLFINGVKIKESNLSNGTLTSTASGYLCFGKTVPVATDQGHTFRGSMDRLRFYSRNLSDTEVAALYQQDSDRDGFWDVVENEWMGTFAISPYYWQNPQADTDRDGLPDSWERLYGLDPLNAAGIHGGTGDPDGDGIPNQSEYALGFHPKNASTDGTADANRDRDGDGMKDWQEAATLQWKWDAAQSKFTFTKVLDWQLADASGDVDQDGLTNIAELNTHKTNPNDWDSDRDLLPDGWEVANGLNPNLSTGSHGADGDLDNDGLSNFKEWSFGTKAGQGGADTDRDGTGDSQEATQGSNPTDASDGGRAPSAAEMREFKIIIGDPSGSHSERWRVEVRDLATGQIIVNHTSRTYGELSAESDSVFKQFRKGKAYEFKLIWMGTDPEKRKQDPEGKLYPDYDWALEVSYKNEAGTWVKLKSPTSDGYLVLDPWNPQTKQLTANNVRLLVDRNDLQYPWEGKPDRTESYQKQIVPHRVNLLPMEFEYFKPNTNSDPQWQDASNKMAWSSLYTFDAPKNESLKFKVTAGGVILTPATLDLIEIEVARHAGDPAHPPTWVIYKLSEIGRISPDKKEAWCTISAADMISKVKIPAVGSSLRHSSDDFIANHNISSYSDSNFVDDWWKPRPESYPLVSARGMGNSTDVIITEADSGEDVPAFSAKANRDYLISGGAMYTALRLAGGSKETRALCHETPDWLYVSGHGWHSAQPAEPGAPAGYPSGCLETIDSDGFGQRQYIIPEETNWNGVTFAIIAGCSVLDINDYNGFYSGTAHVDSPGKRWAATGPALLLGYNQGGPSDRNGGLEIIQRFFSSNPVLATAAGRVDAWRAANAAGKSWNACAIEPSDAYYYFKYNSFIGGSLTSIWTKIPKAAW